MSFARVCRTRSGDLLQKKPKDQPSQAALLLAESERELQRKRMLVSGDDVVISRLTEELGGSRTGSQALSTSPANDLALLTRRLSYTGSLPDSMTTASEVRIAPPPREDSARLHFHCTSPPTFPPPPKQQEQYIMSQEKKFKGVMRALNEGLLVPLTGKALHLLPDEECIVYAVFRPSPTKRGWLQGKLKKIKGSISIRLVGKLFFSQERTARPSIHRIASPSRAHWIVVSV